MLRPVSLSALLTALLLSTPAAAASSNGYADHPEAQKLINTLTQEGFEEGWLRSVLAQAQPQQSILNLMDRPAERRLNWTEYRNIFVVPQRVRQGVEFRAEHADALARAEQEYGVPEEIIVAIIGVETSYGRNMGRHRVLDALATLGFDYPRRADFFRGQLEDYLRLTRDEGMQPGQAVGSYAGAMGYGQFMPSSFRNFAVDFDGDGQRDIWNNPVDAIGSVANYFRAHGWKPGEPVRVRVDASSQVDSAWVNTGLLPEVTLEEWRQRGVIAASPVDLNQNAALLGLTTDAGEEYWFGLHNFYVITRYNHSRMYGMAVYELSQELKQAWQ